MDDAREDRKQRIRERLNSIRAALHVISTLDDAITAYEETGDHNHGQGAIRGKKCPGGDCIVAKARAVLDAIGNAEIDL